jgi:hypothetical protein
MRLDVFMIKFDEEGADAHWARLRAIAPHAILIEGVSGIRAAHAECARRASTSHFFVVDADNWLLDRFSFKLTFQPRDDEVAVWRAKNPINGLVYGHGGIKLLATEAFCGVKHVKEPSVDVATSLTHRYRKIPVLASEHRFNTTPLLTWRSAFRECAKLATYSGREAALRLAAWCSIVNAARHSTWCLQGACDGRDYGRKNIGSPEKLVYRAVWSDNRACQGIKHRRQCPPSRTRSEHNDPRAATCHRTVFKGLTITNFPHRRALCVRAAARREA